MNKMKKPITPQQRYADEQVTAIRCYKGPHRAKLVVKQSRKFIQWLSMDDYRRIKIIQLMENNK